jgi:hypothetical protein
MGFVKDSGIHGWPAFYQFIIGGRRAGYLRVAREVELEILVGVEFGPVGGGGEVSRVRSRVGTDSGWTLMAAATGLMGLTSRLWVVYHLKTGGG